MDINKAGVSPAIQESYNKPDQSQSRVSSEKQVLQQVSIKIQPAGLGDNIDIKA